MKGYPHRGKKVVHAPVSGGHREATAGRFSPHDLQNISPNQNQFEPTPSEPIRQRKRMAGTCS